MRYLLATVLCIGAAGCGSAGATSTVTAPAKTVHVQNNMQLSACQQAMEILIAAEGKTLDAASAESTMQYDKATSIINGVTHKLTIVKPLVTMCRG